MALFAAVEGCTSTKSVENHVYCIGNLIQAGAQVNAEKKGKTILMIAAQKGFIELVISIISQDGWVSHEDNDAKISLHYAIDNKTENLDVVNLLIDHGADINLPTTSDGITPLILAVNRGHLNITRLLVEKGVRMEAKEFNTNNTALHLACLHGHKEIVEILVNEHTFQTIFGIQNKDGQLAKDIAEEKVMDFQKQSLSSS